MTDANATELVTFIRQLWPRWQPPEFTVAELEGWLVSRLTHLNMDSAKLAINAEAEDQQARQFSKSQPIVKAIKHRLMEVNRSESGENAVRHGGQTECEDSHGTNWGRNAQGDLTQDGLTAEEWAVAHEQMADTYRRRGGSMKARRRYAWCERKLRERAASLRKHGFTKHSPVGGGVDDSGGVGEG